MSYPKELDSVQFKHHKIPKKNGKIRHVFEFNKELSGPLLFAYQQHAVRLSEMMRHIVPDEIKTRTAYHKGVSIPMLIDHLQGSKIFVQLDIVDFFNNVRLDDLQNWVPQNYYYDPINKVGIKQGTNISGHITNCVLLEFDKWMYSMNPRYCRYADDIMIGVDTMEEAHQVMELVTTYLENNGLEINKRKTMITDLTEPGDKYVKYLGYTIKRDKYNTNKLRVTISRRKRNEWWAKNQSRHAKRFIGEEEFTCFNT